AARALCRCSRRPFHFSPSRFELPPALSRFRISFSLTLDARLRPTRMPLVRMIGLIALLALELTVLMLRFSTESLEASGQRWWAEMLGLWRAVLPPLAIAMSTAGVLLGGDRLRAEWRRVSSELATPHRAWPFLLAHLAAFAVFAWLTAFILEGSFASSSDRP